MKNQKTPSPFFGIYSIIPIQISPISIILDGEKSAKEVSFLCLLAE